MCYDSTVRPEDPVLCRPQSVDSETLAPLAQEGHHAGQTEIPETHTGIGRYNEKPIREAANVSLLGICRSKPTVITPNPRWLEKFRYNFFWGSPKVQILFPQSLLTDRYAYQLQLLSIPHFLQFGDLIGDAILRVLYASL